MGTKLLLFSELSKKTTRSFGMSPNERLIKGKKRCRLLLFEADVSAAVEGTAFGGSVIGYGLQLTLALAADLYAGHTLGNHVVFECLGAFHSEVTEVLVGGVCLVFNRLLDKAYGKAVAKSAVVPDKDVIVRETEAPGCVFAIERRSPVVAFGVHVLY